MGYWKDFRHNAANFAAALSLIATAEAGSIALTPSLAAAPRSSNTPMASSALIGGETTTPYGWAEFCRRYAGECDAGVLPALDITLTPKAMKEIEWVNTWVNAHVKSVSDMDHWGVIDQWDYPTDGKGDCEDYALFKRKILLLEGFPRQALLMTVAKDAHNEGHAVLTVKTDAGEFILDNLNDEVKSWDRTGYRFVKRQAQFDQNVWLQIGDPTAAPDYVSR
ncbi:MAG TPA: transglutaminase-like cysteine peptidase [Methylocella sp.]|nr:transglutaminase-like cysteine peptidase [Methylocella sp.]